MNVTRTKALGAALILTALALAALGWRLGIRPPLFQAAATVQVQRDQFDLPELSEISNLTATATSDNNYFLATEMAMIPSEAVLGRVVTNPGLNNAWGQRQAGGRELATSKAVQLLKARLQVQPGAEPAQITIAATSEVATEAAALANATAQAYCEYRRDVRRRLARTALDALAGKYSETERQIADAREKVAQAGQRLGPDLREQVATNQATNRETALRALHAAFSESVLRYLTQSNQLALYQSKHPQPDAVVEELRARAEQAKAGMLAAETAAHAAARAQSLVADYQAARAELDDLTQRFAPVQETMSKLRAKLDASGPAPALIVAPATPPAAPGIPATISVTLTNGLLFVAAGIAAIGGAGLLVFSMKPRNPAG